MAKKFSVTLVLNLLFQSVILLLSACYIYVEISESPQLFRLQSLLENLSLIKFLILFVVLLLCILNWGIEAKKWQKLISEKEKISFGLSFKSILSSVSMSIFSPNRIGEMGGKVLFLKKASRIEAMFISLIGSFSQLLITLSMGLIAVPFFVYYFPSENLNLQSFTFWLIFLLSTSLLIVLFFLFFNSSKAIGLFSKIKSERLQNYLKTLTEFDKNKLPSILSLSFLRYLVFSLQFYLLLIFFGVNTGLLPSLMMIALVYLVFAIIPTFALSEIGVKGSATLFFFGFLTTSITETALASFLLWIINLALPAVIGFLFLSKAKLFRNA